MASPILSAALTPVMHVPEHGNGGLAPWQNACAEKQATQLDRIPTAWRITEPILPRKDVRNVISLPRESGLLSDRELAITELDDVDLLLERLATAEYSAAEVTTAFCKRAALAHQVTNCLTEFWFEEAIEYARSMDRYLHDNGKPFGILHGLPISLKDQFQLAGKECNMGWASWMGRISKVDSDLVTCLRKAGAIFYCRTNCPQTLMASEGVNHVYGRALNPYQRGLTTGGSSAGEGALLAMRGSPLGVGTDVGGSIRIPSSFCGLYGLKPTTRRVPYGNAMNVFLGAEGIESAIGPMSTNLAGCVTWMKGLMSTKPWLVDAQVVPMPWREDMYRLEHLGATDPKLCFGYYDFDGLVQVQPPIKRAIATMISALRSAGHEVIEWKPKDHVGILDVLKKIFDADGGEDLRRTTNQSGETIVPNVAMVLGRNEGVTVWESWQLNLRKNQHREAHLKQWIATASTTATGRPIDGLIAPATATVAFPHNQSKYFGYTGVCNLWDVPAIVIPIDCVTPSKDVKNEAFEAVSELDQEVQDSFDPDRLEGCPASLQIIGMRFQEEELLGVARVASEALKAFKLRET